MKTLFLRFFWLSAVILALSSCSKEGPAGVEGPQGPQGPAGNQGVPGPAGSANVTLYKYGSMTFTTARNLIIPNMTQDEMDKSLILAYYNPTNELVGTWYAIPGMGSGSNYQVRSFWGMNGNQALYSIRVLTPAGANYSSSVTFRAVHIFVIPAANVVNGRTATPLYDVNDYHSVANHFGIN